MAVTPSPAPPMDLRDRLTSSLGGAYTIDRELGGGGMSRVFVATDTALGRLVVIKVVPPDIGEQVNAERFKREIQVAARLQHAHIVPVLVAGEADGLSYYVMPYVEGLSLRTRLASNAALPVNEAIGILRDVARALAYAHDHGVVHRDIKPDNVLLSGGSAVVTDFGIAKAISAARSGPQSTLTQVGVSLGTPAYMAPEQAAADPSADHRADLYAFGCLGYELLAGRPPFTAKSAQRLLAAHMADTPAPVADLRPDTPHPVAALIMRCLEKDPDRRPQSAAELMRVLDNMTSGTGMTAMPPMLGAVAMRKALLVYAAAFLGVAGVALAATMGLGLPDWVFNGVLIVMALGLPVVLFTGYAQRLTRHAVTATPTYTPGGTPEPFTARGPLAGLAIKASPVLSWRNTARGGMFAVGGFAAIAAVVLVLGTAGLGPAATLVSSGKVKAREPLLVTDFKVTNADSTLGRMVGDFAKATLGQSNDINLIPPTGVADALRRMNLPPSTLLDLPRAQDLARRNGIKSIVDGEVTGLGGGSGFVIVLRLVTTDSARELMRVKATAKDQAGLIDAVDDLSRQFREKLGESMRKVRATPRYADVTTTSFDALRKYTEAARLYDVEFRRPQAIALLREAVALDTAFAAAWRKMAAILISQAAPRARIDSALTQAFRFRDRVPERERDHIDAIYYSSGPGRDRGKAAALYEDLIRRGDSSAAHNLALVLMSRREFARADSLLALSQVHSPDRTLGVASHIRVLIYLGKWQAADSAIAAGKARGITGVAGAPLRRWTVDALYLKGDTAAYRRTIDSVRMHGDSTERAWAHTRLRGLAALGGRPAESRRWVAMNQADTRTPTPQVRLTRLIGGFEAALAGPILGKPEGFVRALDSAVAAVDFTKIPDVDRPDLQIAMMYARVGRADRARAAVARLDAQVKDTALLRWFESYRHAVMGEILLAENKPTEAIAAFRKSDVLPDGPSTDCSICLPRALGRAFAQAGMVDSAIVHLERFMAAPYPDRMVDNVDPLSLALLSRTLGEMYEKKGDRAKAAAYYQKFVDLWAKAEPELQPQVTEIRNRLKRLSDPEKPRGG